jgi:hypothetical protein
MKVRNVKKVKKVRKVRKVRKVKKVRNVRKVQNRISAIFQLHSTFFKAVTTICEPMLSLSIF